uniref:Uncharacterized protein n=1 Tax=Anguilla anguilla TaxID=7936 RepID=A0A0E9TBD9_ANGAN
MKFRLISRPRRPVGRLPDDAEAPQGRGDDGEDGHGVRALPGPGRGLQARRRDHVLRGDGEAADDPLGPWVLRTAVGVALTD